MTLAARALVASVSLAAATAAHADVAQRLAAIEAASGGTLGVSAVNVKTGERVRFKAGQRFPMASTFKVPVAMKVLEQVDRGAIALDERVPIDPANLSPGSGELGSVDPGAETASTVGELLKRMLRDSDNTATDVLLARIGGPRAVTAHVQGLGITGLEVSRPTGELIADAWGFKLPPPGKRTRENLQRAQRTIAPEKRAAAVRAFLEDPRDATTPDAMVEVLVQLRQGKALAPKSTGLLLEHMEQCRTGPKRLKGELPRGTPVAHKTGTLTRVATNDVGIVPLGWSNGPMVVAIYVKGSSQPLATQERAIAEAALALYRHYTR
jgi:beta-lactamase class A